MALVLTPVRSRRAIALTVVTVMFATVVSTVQFATSTPPSGALGTSPKAPVIREPFTPLPCRHDTTIGLEGCAEGQLLAADRRLNDQVQVVLVAIATMHQRRQFVTVEAQWLTYRTSDCTNVAATFEGGTIQPVEYALCELRDDEARSSDLHSFFSLLEEGRSGPAWP
ncbi:MAG: lysozyme inhibitor LprI family protein [Acidimicrobiales bacterium]